jgi:hypothetical protein
MPWQRATLLHAAFNGKFLWVWWEFVLWNFSQEPKEFPPDSLHKVFFFINEMGLLPAISQSTSASSLVHTKGLTQYW